MSAVLFVLSFLLPVGFVALIAGAGVLPPGVAHRVRRRAGLFAPLAVLPAGLSALTGESELEVPWLMLGSTVAVDAVGRGLLLIAVLLYGAALSSITWLKLRDAERGSAALPAWLLICFCGTIGTYLAADLVTFYLAFAVMSFSAVGLIIHHRDEAARRASRIYLVLSVLSETLILAAVVLLGSALVGSSESVDPEFQDDAAPDTQEALLLEHVPGAVMDSPHTGLILGLLLLGFGVKVGTVPLHVWLPLAHPAAPPAASAVLSGVMVKVGLVGWLRFLPLGEDGDAASRAAVEIAAWALVAAALAGAFLAVLVGVLQQDPKVVLAYSTISQMGFIAVLVGVGLLETELAPLTSGAAVAYAVHHGLAKGALFLGVPVVKHYGHGPTGLLVLLGMLGAGAAVAGAPFTSGAFGKYTSKEAVEGVTVLGVGLESILPWVAAGSTLLLLRFGWVIWHADRAPQRRADGELFAWLAVCAAGITVPWLIGTHWMPEEELPAEAPSWEPAVLWDATWPILAGLVIGAAVWALRRRGFLPERVSRADGTLVAPGDLIVAEESLAMRAASGTARSVESAHRGLEDAAGRVSSALLRAGGRARSWMAGAETKLAAWETSGMVLLLVLAATVLLWWWS
ncbi:proton-conducting transporter membrane subunit [Nesterenkonia lacusekhoensis]|uniref:Formate hydrogenlyase subunit 3/multisubunit Na+/H+ antiporter MnhD subunit n=1 Tax=Nesterenkonia lacusekhoensis TaxID=150832 RepID=A0ABS4T5P7_9MICC|nr:proton-conducting transporter membrane subunit [Nesterenkonia lacusekhoensis]MBP2319299.1 formate hydrogenlyase subunit 3/multisubunit Na+/H+ antiporter MnhD subunit [Nesterenkonia lacusekhoensis]